MNPNIDILIDALNNKSTSVSLWKRELINAINNPQDIRDFISKLQNEIHFSEDHFEDRIPFYYFFQSIAYLTIGKYQEAKETLSDSSLGFRTQGLSLNEAITEWLFEIIHLENGDLLKSQRACEKASDIILSLIDECKAERRHERAKEYTNYLRQIEALLADVTNPTGPQFQKDSNHSTSKTQNSTTEKKPLFSLFKKSPSKQPHGIEITPPRVSRDEEDELQKTREETSQKTDNIVSEVKHIVIPVDVQALKDRNPTLHILDGDVFDILQSYEKKIGDRNGKNESRPARGTPHPKPVTVPGFPIYGSVAADPNGIPNLDFPESEAEPVHNKTYINFGNRKFEITFISDKSATAMNSIRHGWLKVIGESMNISTPIPINNGDYVLFSENHDLISCLSKIVVAGLPESHSQPPQLVVKRLHRSETSDAKHPEFVLRSEALDKNPRYKQDIKIISDNQLAGEVIAIAKQV